MSLQTLIEQKNAIEAQIAETRISTRGTALAEIRRLLSENGLTVADLEPPKKNSAQKVAVKYRDGSGNTWAGRGLKPTWLRNAISAGVPLETYLVAK